MPPETGQLAIVANDLAERVLQSRFYRQLQEMSDPNGHVSPLVAVTMAIDAITAHALSDAGASRARAVATLFGAPNLTLSDTRSMIIGALGGDPGVLDETR